MISNGLTPSRSAWACLGLIALADVGAVAAMGWSVAWSDLVLIVGAGLSLLGVAVIYARFRPAPIIAAACSSVAFIVLFTAALAVLSYLSVGVGRPLMDASYAQFDRALGFDWTGHLEAVVARPWLATTLTLVYFSCQAQLLIVIVGLSLVDRKALGEFLTLYALTAVAVVGLATLMPAVGAYIHHAPGRELLASLPDPDAGRWHLAHFNALRDGVFTHLSLRSVEGLITFPSFHTALAVLFARALLRLPYLGMPGLVLNGLMILSTLSIGGHYLVDVLAGGMIALVAVAALHASPIRSRQGALQTAS